MRALTSALCACLLLSCAVARLRGDQVEMQNGDRYLGRVLSLNAESVVLQSEVLGKVTLPRGRVAIITLGTNAPAAPAPSARLLNSPLRGNASPGFTNANPDLAAALRTLGANTNFIRQVREQFLSAAGPEANRKFDDLVGGLMSGRLDLNDIRSEAKSAADQLRALKKDSGGDPTGSLDGYLAILDNFLKETAPATNAAGAPANPQSKSGAEP